MKIFEKLRLKLNKELNLNIPEDAVFKRVRASKEQVSAGAWSWSCTFTDNYRQIGSQFTATEIIKAKKISYETTTGWFPEIWVDEV